MKCTWIITLGMLAGCALPAAAQTPTEQKASDDKEAYLVVTVPEGARLLVDGYETKTKGEVRRFETPPLMMGKKYAYKLKATWTDEAGKEVVRERKVTVKAGEETSVDLRKEEPAKDEKTGETKSPKTDEKGPAPKEKKVPKIEEEEEKASKDKKTPKSDEGEKPAKDKPVKDGDKKATDKGS
jgi:uncharacterized protein (TIGR03000 family)